jgi:hypothetical protein
VPDHLHRIRLRAQYCDGYRLVRGRLQSLHQLWDAGHRRKSLYGPGPNPAATVSSARSYRGKSRTSRRRAGVQGRGRHARRKAAPEDQRRALRCASRAHSPARAQANGLLGYAQERNRLQLAYPGWLGGKAPTPVECTRYRLPEDLLLQERIRLHLGRPGVVGQSRPLGHQVLVDSKPAAGPSSSSPRRRACSTGLSCRLDRGTRVRIEHLFP